MKVVVAICAALTISLFGNIALGFNLSSKSQENKEFNKEIMMLEEKVKSLKKGLNEAEEVITDENLIHDEDGKEVVESFFKTQYEYNSDSYKKRFENIKSLVNDDVYGQLTAAGIPDIPNANFENKINDMKLFLTAQNKELTGLVLLDTVYQIEGLDSPETTQIFQVKVAEQDGQKKIVSLEVLGTFASMSES